MSIIINLLFLQFSNLFPAAHCLMVMGITFNEKTNSGLGLGFNLNTDKDTEEIFAAINRHRYKRGCCITRLIYITVTETSVQCH